MKTQKFSRTLVMAVGMGAAWLLVTPVRGQSDTKAKLSGADFGTSSIAEVATSVAPNVLAATVVAPAASEPVEVTEEDVQPAGFTIEVALLTLILAGGMGFIYLYAKVATRHERQPNISLRRRIYNSTSDATTPSTSGVTTH
jgi:hypothetical protein